MPAFQLVNTCRDGRYRIEKQIVTDPHRDTVLQQVRFIAQQGALSDYHLHVLLAPHLGNQGGGNTAWVGEFEGTPLLFAQRNGYALALACSAPWTKRSAGYVGSSDGWQDLKAHKQMTWEYTRAENGNVALTAGIDLSKSQGDFVLALGFGKDPDEAARNAIASLRDGFDKAKHDYIAGWQEWMKTHASPKKSGRQSGRSFPDQPRRPAHPRIQDSARRVSSPASPSRGDSARVTMIWAVTISSGRATWWKRQAACSLPARTRTSAACSLICRQPSSRMGTGRRTCGWTARPIGTESKWTRRRCRFSWWIWPIAKRHWPRPMWPGFGRWCRKAAGYLARNGPVSPQDRWEEDPGYSPFTVAAEIAALLAAADLADLNHEASIATYLREIADVWNTSIDRWMYVSGTDWCRKFNVEGYYVRIAPTETGAGGSRFQKNVHVKNVAAAEDTRRASHLISPDALALVRFGLRAADDPRIRDTAKVIDALLKVETPSGPTWHRYNDDGYGEHEDGAPFDGTGIGRGWPLLTGERAHYELAAGRVDDAKRLLAAMESFANEGGLISEQVWDSPDIPERELHFGRPSGSAMPLVWAHAEYLKLRRSLRDGRVFDLPPQTVQRYLTEKTVSPRMVWRFNHKIRSMPAGKILRIETLAPAVIHWSADDWKTVQDVTAHDVGLGIHIADLPTKALPEGKQIKFTFHWPEADRLGR